MEDPVWGKRRDIFIHRYRGFGPCGFSYPHAELGSKRVTLGSADRTDAWSGTVLSPIRAPRLFLRVTLYKVLTISVLQ